MNNETGTVTGTMTDEERDTILLRIRKLLNLQENATKIGSEGEAYAAELRDRQAKHLTGAEGRKHYNDWMQRNGMEHLMIK